MSELRALAGTKVLDLSMYIAGPSGTQLLADMGATVIKLEPLLGDPVRYNRIGPQIRGENAQFRAVNRGKHSVALNLKSPDGVEIAQALARQVDVVYDNFRPGVMARLGLDYDHLRVDNPGVITCSLSGFGRSGPWSSFPAFDLIIQAVSGAMLLTGHDVSGPTRVGYPVGDTAGGVFAALGVVAALLRRSATGVGGPIDVSLFESQLALIADEVTHAGLGQRSSVSQFWGTGHPYLVPYRAFDTADGKVVVAAGGRDAFWERLCAAVGLPELASDASLRTNDQRVARREYVEAVLADRFAARSTDAWLEILRTADVPVAPVMALSDVITSDHAAQGGTFLVDEVGATTVRCPVRFEGDGEPSTEVPRLGEHTRQVLADYLGLAGEEAERLIRLDVVRQADS